MDERHRRLISLLRQSVRPVSGKRLAAELGVTTRSVINYVHAINASADRTLISSCSQGYSLCMDVDITAERVSTPQSHADRQAYLAKVLLIDHPEGINAFDLSDELIISYSLLKQEISDLNTLCSGLDVSIVSRGNVLSVVGSEHDKRRLMTTVIHNQQGDAMLSIGNLQSYFGDAMIKPILSVINRNAVEAGAYINDFARLNLALHIAIAVSRVRNGNTLPDQSVEHGTISTSIQAGPLARSIANEIEETFGVVLNASDYNQILMLVESHVHASGTEPRQAVDGATRGQLDDLEDIMRQVKERYYLDFTSREFPVPVSLHVANLLVRLKQGIHVDNPIKETFRDSSPFLYDIASYVIGEVLDRNGMPDVVADDNELTFLVMYLALELQRQQQDDGMTRVLLYFPSCLGIETGLAERIRARFSDQAKVVGRISGEDEIEAGTYDVLITFVGLEKPVSGRVVRISPVPTQHDWGRMGDAITQVQQERLVSNFRSDFPLFFDEQNFIYSTDGNVTRDVAIHMLCQLLEQTGCVTPGFEEGVLERERAISTGYKGFAVPHAVGPYVSQDAVAVLVDPKGIKWGNVTACVIMLMAIKPDGLVGFQHMYNGLLLLLLETNVALLLRKVESFVQLRGILLGQPAPDG